MLKRTIFMLTLALVAANITFIGCSTTEAPKSTSDASEATMQMDNKMMSDSKMMGNGSRGDSMMKSDTMMNNGMMKDEGMPNDKMMKDTAKQ